MKRQHRQRRISAGHLEDFSGSAVQTRLSLAVRRCQHCCVLLVMTADVDARSGSVIGRACQLLTLTLVAADGEAAGCSTVACTACNAGPAADESTLLAVTTTDHGPTTHHVFLMMQLGASDITTTKHMNHRIPTAVVDSTQRMTVNE